MKLTVKALHVEVERLRVVAKGYRTTLEAILEVNAPREP